MNYLIAGGAGFIGTNLCEYLVMKGHHVSCIDNLNSGKYSNVKLIKSSYPNNYNFIQKSIINFDVREASNHYLSDIDCIVNLACPASPPIYQNNPIYTIETNVSGTKNLLDLAEITKCRFVQASTSEIYGNPLVHPQTEEYLGNVNPIGKRSCYDVGKRMAETLCFEYKKRGVDVGILRIFNTYGEFMSPDDGRVVSNFINQALENKPITVYGDGSQTRSLCYVSDMVDAFCKMISVQQEFGPINVGNPQELTILELAEIIIYLTKSKSKIVFMDLPKDDPIKRKPDIHRAINILNFQPKIELRQGLSNTIEYYKKLRL